MFTHLENIKFRVKKRRKLFAQVFRGIFDDDAAVLQGIITCLLGKFRDFVCHGIYLQVVLVQVWCRQAGALHVLLYVSDLFS